MKLLTPATAAQNRKGAIAMVGSMAAFVMNDALVKLATSAYPTSQVLAIRGMFATAIVLAVIISMGSLRDLAAIRNPLVILRGTLEAVIAFTFITALASLPLGNITAILQASSLVLVALAALLGIERVGWRRWVAVAIGFAGVIMIIRPAADGFTVASLVALLSAILVAGRDLVTRRIDAAVPSTIVTLVTTVLVCATGWLIAAVEPWQPFTLRDSLYLFGAAVFVALGNYAIIVAFRGTDMSVVTGFRYTIVVFALALGALIWGDWPDGLALFGTLLIVGSGLYTLHRQRVRRNVETAQ